MKNNLICPSIAAVLAAVAVYAQSSITLEANVPFDFIAGGKTLAAGAYTVGYSASGVVVINSADGNGRSCLWRRGWTRLSVLIKPGCCSTATGTCTSLLKFGVPKTMAARSPLPIASARWLPGQDVPTVALSQPCVDYNVGCGRSTREPEGSGTEARIQWLPSTVCAMTQCGT
jgi:hypothetical protein